MRIKYDANGAVAASGMAARLLLPIAVLLGSCATSPVISGNGAIGDVYAVRGIPLYPGAKLFGTQKGNGRVIYISLVTEDSPGKVAEFYTRRLEKRKGWSSVELLDGRHFWLGGKEPDPYGILGKPIPDVRISPVFGAAEGRWTLIAIQNRGGPESQ